MYNDKKSNLDKCHQNIKFLAIEMFKVFKGISPQILKEIFQFRDAMPYQLRKQTNFQIPSAHSAVNGTESIKFLGICCQWHRKYKISRNKNLRNFTS